MPRPAREMLRGHEDKGRPYKVTAQIRHNMNTGHYPSTPHVTEFTRMHQGVIGMYATKENEERRQHAAQTKDIQATQKRHKKDHLNDMFNLD